MESAVGVDRRVGRRAADEFECDLFISLTSFVQVPRSQPTKPVGVCQSPGPVSEAYQGGESCFQFADGCPRTRSFWFRALVMSFSILPIAFTSSTLVLSASISAVGSGGRAST
jgi:hypothetical protein